MADWRDGSTMLSPRDRADDDDCVELVDVGVIGREPDEEEDAGGAASEVLDLALPLL